MTAAPVLDRHEVQGNILRPYKLDHARYLLVTLPEEADARGLLAQLVPLVTSMAAHPARGSGTAVNVAITHSGFARLGVRAAILDRFPAAFRTTTTSRAQLLGDTDASDPQTWEPGVGTGAVHLLITLHADNEGDAASLDAGVGERLAAAGAERVATTCANRLDGMREHFGYADGASQPDVEGVYPPGRSRAGGGVPTRSGWRQLKLGEFLLGHPDEDGITVTAPDPELVRNGSYVVYRKLEQKVAEFEAQLDANAKALGIHRELLAAKLVGRWRDGVPIELQPERELAPNTDLTHVDVGTPANEFRYLPADADGNRCPVGAHVRRTNPRDSLDFGGQVPDAGRLTSRHRIIRRGMPYGTPFDPRQADDTERGLVFVCYNADIARQFETVQIEWCNGGNVFNLGPDPDFLLAPGGADRKMTIPREGQAPWFVPLPTAPVVITRGAEYLFAPGLSALGKLAAGVFG